MCSFIKTAVGFLVLTLGSFESRSNAAELFLKRGCLQVVGAGVELEDVALFIDQNHSGLQKPAELKFGWGGELAELVLRVLYLAP